MLDTEHMIKDIVWQVAVAEGDRKSFGRRAWSRSEEKFVRSQIGHMTDAEIGQALGRSEVAIKIRRVRKGMPAHSKRPGWLTGNRACYILNIDIHAMMRLVERGLISVEILPGKRGIINIKYSALVQWAIDPKHWIYFKPEKVRDAKLKRLLELRAKRWGDEWWTVGQIATWYGVDQRLINNAIRAGRIDGVKWGNWKVRRSEALKAGLYFFSGKGAGQTIPWSDEAEIFMILSREKGLTLTDIGRMMKISSASAWSHYRLIVREGIVDDLKAKFGIGQEENL